MDVEAAIRTRLLTDAMLPHYIGDRVSWIDRPRGEDYPAITLQVISETRAQHLKGFHPLQQIIVQLDIWARTHLAGKVIKDAVLEALIPEATIEGVKFLRAFATARDLSEKPPGEPTVFRPCIDFTFNYQFCS